MIKSIFEKGSWVVLLLLSTPAIAACPIGQVERKVTDYTAPTTCTAEYREELSCSLNGTLCSKKMVNTCPPPPVVIMCLTNEQLETAKKNGMLN